MESRLPANPWENGPPARSRSDASVVRIGATSGGTIIGLFVVSQQVFAPPSKLEWWRSPKSVKNDLVLHTYLQSEFYHPVQSPVTHRIRNPASIALLRWQEENRKELEKHFVLMRVDWIRDENVGAIVDRYSVVNNGETALASVLVNKEGLFLHDTSGDSPYNRMSSSQFIDRERMGTLMRAASHPMDPLKWKALFDSL